MAELRCGMTRITRLLAIAGIAAAMSGSAAAAKQEFPQPADFQTYYIYFLTKGPNYGKGTPEEQKDIQAKHMGHLNSLGAAGKIAGPIGTEGPRRGLVILKAASLADARAIGEADPAVKAGTFGVEIYTLVLPRNWFDFGPVPEPYQMRRFVFAIFDRVNTLPPMSAGELTKLEQAHIANLYRLSREGKIELAGPLADGGVHRGVAVLRTDTIDEALQWLASDPLVKAGVLTVTPLRWFAADGIMLRR